MQYFYGFRKVELLFKVNRSRVLFMGTLQLFYQDFT